jgi:acyl-homoserine-lactone acylase
MSVSILILLAAAHAATPAPEVTIRRDTYGIPHILAATEEAAAFGLGFAQAEDHCVAIARKWIAARGESAKYFQEGAERDLLLAQFDQAAACRRGFERMDPLMRRIYRAFVAGFNHYVAKNRARLPEWMPVFDEFDLVAMARTGAVAAAGTAARRLAARGQDAADGDDGSNAFALAPSRTVSGNAILLGNPHLSWASLYWEAQVTVPGKINFFGSTLAGIPVLRAGFNEHLGWVTTNNAPDMADVYELKLDPARPDHYLFEGKARRLERREVAAGGLRKTVERSHLGEIIHRTRDAVYAYRSTQLDSFRHFEGFYRLSKTRSHAEWMKVMRRNLTDYSNFTYADAAGNVQYLWNGRVPKRRDIGASYAGEAPGEAKSMWRGMHKVREFPQLRNPPGGYIQNCNNPPWFVSLRDPLNPADYPSYFERGPLGLRPQLALELLESREKFTLEDVIRMKFDPRLLLADRVKPDLVRALKDAGRNAEAALMESWDNQAGAESRGALVFTRFWDTYSRRVKQPYAIQWDPAGPGRTPSGLADRVAAIDAFGEAMKWTRRTYGASDAAWGEAMRFRFAGVDLPAEGASGLYGAFRVMGFSPQPDGRRVAGWVADDQPLAGSGDAWVLAVEFGKPLEAWSVLAYGQTTDSKSRHSTDQIGLFANRRLRRVWFTEAGIRANLEREYRP